MYHLYVRLMDYVFGEEGLLLLLLARLDGRLVLQDELLGGLAAMDLHFRAGNFLSAFQLLLGVVYGQHFVVLAYGDSEDLLVLGLE